MKEFLGKEVKPLKEPKWQIVESSVQKPKASVLKSLKSIVVCRSDYDDNQYYALIKTDSWQTTFDIDRKLNRFLKPKDELDPKSIMVYEITDGKYTKTVLYGEKL